MCYHVGGVVPEGLISRLISLEKRHPGGEPIVPAASRTACGASRAKVLFSVANNSHNGRSHADASVAHDGISAGVDDGVGGPALNWRQLVQAPALVLNLNYVPLNVCTVRRAIVLVDKGKAELLENHQADLHTVSSVIEAPSIVRLVYLVRKPLLPRKLSKKEVFLRDRVTCQYGGKKAPDLTVDHVVPRRQGGGNSWDNVVAACNRCNLRKAGRTPMEARMTLGKAPKAPDPNPYLILQNRVILEEWRQYLPWTVQV